MAANVLTEVNLTKFHIDLPHHWGTGGESFLAEELGFDLYPIRSVPFPAFGLNFYDVVRATANSPGLKPEIREIFEPSGRRTLRILFKKSVSRDKQIKLLESLDEHFYRTLKDWIARAEKQLKARIYSTLEENSDQFS